MAGDKDVSIALVLESVKTLNNRLEKMDSNIGKLFDRQNELNVILERNTITVEQHHRRSTMLEKLQLRYQKRVDNIEHEVKEVGATVATLTTMVTEIGKDMTPVKAHVSEVSKWVHFFTKLPPLVKFTGSLLALIVSGYGCISIVKDLIARFLK